MNWKLFSRLNKRKQLSFIPEPSTLPLFGFGAGYGLPPMGSPVLPAHGAQNHGDESVPVADVITSQEIRYLTPEHIASCFFQNVMAPTVKHI